jgi:hypothetical protein
MRAFGVLLLSFTLAACSTSDDLVPIKPYVPPAMPTADAVGKGIKQAAAEAKLTGPIEMSDLRQTDHGPGSYMLCIRGVESKYSRIVIYAVFFDNEVYKGLRLPVILDDCEKQAFRPYVGAIAASPATPPSPVAPPVGHHHRTQQQPS